MIRYVLFDVDDTLYPASSGLGHELGRRMVEFTARHLGVGRERAGALIAEGRRRHGTTLSWLCAEADLQSPEPFIEAIHPADLSPWITDDHAREAREALDAIDLPAAVLTNGPREHAQRVLERLGISDRFERVFDLRENGFVGKPARHAYRRALDELSLDATTTLFVDDVVQYLLPFRDLGGRIVHMTTPGSANGEVPSVTSLRDLVRIIYPGRSRG